MDETRRTKTFIGAMMLAALSTAGYAGFASHTPHGYLAGAVLVLAVATSRMKVNLPGINGNMSINLPFLLTAILALSGAEAAVIALVSTAFQCWPRTNAKLNLPQMTFNLSMMTFASSSASIIVHGKWFSGALSHSATLQAVLATLTMFLAQTVPVAGIVAVSEGKSAAGVWWNIAHLSFPYFVISAGVTTMVEATSSHLGWGLALAVLPVMYGIHRSYRLYFHHFSEIAPQQVLVKAAGAGA